MQFNDRETTKTRENVVSLRKKSRETTPEGSGGKSEVVGVMVNGRSTGISGDQREGQVLKGCWVSIEL